MRRCRFISCLNTQIPHPVKTYQLLYTNGSGEWIDHPLQQDFIINLSKGKQNHHDYLSMKDEDQLTTLAGQPTGLVTFIATNHDGSKY